MSELGVCALLCLMWAQGFAFGLAFHDDVWAWWDKWREKRRGGR